MSVYTDITSNREVAGEAVDEPGPAVAELAAKHLPDEDRVVAGLVLGPRAALQPGERAVEQRAALAVPDVDPAPERDRRNSAAGEVPSRLLLLAGEQAGGEPASAADWLVRRRLPADRDPDQRRLEGE